MKNAVISGTGFHVPERIVTNDDLVREYGMETSHEWIVKRTGIEARRFTPDGVATEEIAALAAEQAIADAGLEKSDIEMTVVATVSPRHAFPGAGVYINDLLGMTGVPAMDVRNQCTGFIYALQSAMAQVRAGIYKHVLVIGAEVHSKAADLTTRGRTVASLFGDGAGACVVSASDDDRGIKQTYLGADGAFADVLIQKVWDMRHRPYIPVNEDGSGTVPVEDMWAHMNGKLVFKHAIEKLSGSLMQVCWDAGINPSDLDMVLFHQANMRINQYVQKALGLDPDKVPNNIQRYGNTTAATLPILMAEAVQNGSLKPGMKIALVAFGSGFTWGAAIIDW